LDGALYRSAKMMMKILDKEEYQRNKKGTPAPDAAAEILSQGTQREEKEQGTNH
tara:strand:+ start:286 stop:447 length:162 start_codon:yes stop_codon:yes gene_type:complete